MADDILKAVHSIRPRSEIGLADPEGRLPLGAAGLADVFTKAIRGWHGSPYKFDKFEWNKDTRGTGEGSAAFGEGTYIGEARGTGEAYRDIARRRHPSSVVMPDGTLIPEGKMTTAQALAAGATQWPGDPVSNLSKLPTNSLYTRDVIDEALGLVQQGIGYRKAGHLYEVDIHADRDKFLDLDKPIAEQNLPSVFSNYVLGKNADGNIRGKGSDLYERLSRETGSSLAATDVLHKAGIPGNKFLDANSRTSGGATGMIANYGSREKALEVAMKRLAASENSFGIQASKDRKAWADMVKELERPESRNFVVFDPRIIKIVSVMGIAGALGAGLISQEMADQMRSQGVEG